VPGFLKWGYETYWMSATDPGITLTNVEVTNRFKSSKIQLVDTAVSGIIESSDLVFSRSAKGSVWEYDVQSFIRESGSIIVEYSLDSGSSWSPIENIVSVNPISGTIRFRATLNRSSVTDRSPLFEIVRARYSRIDMGTLINPITNAPTTGPWILVMPSQPERQYMKSEHGDYPQGTANFWTSGLSMFDPLVTPNTREEILIGPAVLVQFMDGVLAGERYATTSWKHTDPFAYKVVTQDFNIRPADAAGPYSLVF
jgi:hypothetical protein